MKYSVTHTVEVEADTPEQAALEFDRLSLTYRLKDVAVTAPKTPTVFIRVTRGEAKRIA